MFGCSEAPADEAKVTVTATDMMGNVVTRQVTPTQQPGISLGAGYTTFRAPALDASASVAQPPGSAEPVAAPPPPPAGGSGIAPPPFAGPAPAFVASGHAPGQLVNYYQPSQPKTRVLFVLLGIFLGAFGVHNFYAGYIQKGAVQLCLTLLTCFYGAAVSWPWAIVEICVINKDAEGNQFV